MKRYTLQERIEIIKIHYKNGENLTETVRETRTFLGRREAPCRTAIKKLVEKFELLAVSEVKNKTRARRPRTVENIGTQTSLHHILHKDLSLKAYKVQLTQELKIINNVVYLLIESLKCMKMIRNSIENHLE